MASRPEEIAPPEIFYNETEARKYTTSSRMIEIQVCLNGIIQNARIKIVLSVRKIDLRGMLHGSRVGD